MKLKLKLRGKWGGKKDFFYIRPSKMLLWRKIRKKWAHTKKYVLIVHNLAF